METPKDMFNLPPEECGKPEYAKIIETLHFFTLNYARKLFMKYARIAYRKQLDLSKIKFDEKTNEYLYYETPERAIPFNMMTKMISIKGVNKMLTSKKRYGDCHGKSIQLSRELENTSVLTGCITVNNSRILHSVIFYKDNEGKDMIMDYTGNLIMPYEEYKRLNKFNPLSVVTREQIIHDTKVFMNNPEAASAILKGGVKNYLLNRNKDDEQIHDL